MSTRLSRLQRSRRPRPTLEESLAAGRERRRSHPRSEVGDIALAADRDPLGILGVQNATRLEELVPLRMERMASSPFAFYRGTAGVMAADLAREPVTGIRVVSCGDAHVSNFGLYASPQRSIVFDLNDFDEAALAPWEWDVKRLVTSVIIAATDAGADPLEARESARLTARAYQRALAELMRTDVLGRYYRHVEAEAAPDHPLLPKKARKDVGKDLDVALRKARRRTSDAYLRKISTRDEDGTLQIVEDPPVLTHVDPALEDLAEDLFERYRTTVPADVAELLSHYTLADVARRVVGVGSVGTRCYILVLEDPSHAPLILQMKEAQDSVLETFGGIVPAGIGSAADSVRPYEGQGHRVVASQRILQAVSDPFLGYLSAGGRDYYVRQFRDMKGSFETSDLSRASFRTYVISCAALLARAHAQSLDAPQIAGYLGSSDTWARAITAWAESYAAQSLADVEALRESLGR
ncbi:DUF2252 domain-containing protein [Brachybacterium hainanense]|uniref:DUF2252 domain-containing protein n=1 Tax=Brachybacterium hainanense TaxID=1541174 RepID=A0ABV6RCE4_9MICO